MSVNPYGFYQPTIFQKLGISLMHNTVLGGTSLRRRWLEYFRHDCRGALDTKLFNLKVRVYPKDNQTDAKGALCGTSYNSKELKWLKKYLKPNMVFLDIGSNMGFFSLFAAKLGADIVAIEANKNLSERFEYNFQLNGFDYEIFNNAVGAERKKVKLNFLNDDLGSTNVVESSDGTIEMLPLIDIITQSNNISENDIFLKIDIEGHECDALIPFFEIAPNSLFPKFIIMEKQPNEYNASKLHRTLVQSGLYKQKSSTRSNILYIRN
ncbi:FkbM family methyltransferase [Neokomagataea thailandica]|nr:MULTISPECIES: FkbM family methyltransferase [Neokomagataea]